MKNRVWAFAIPAVILLAVFLVPSLLTSQSAVMDKPSKEDVTHKMQSIQIPFVANNGQVDAQVKYYANTFGGTVFVTKDGEIVYSLPMVAHASPLVHYDIDKNETGYTGLTGYRGKEGQCIVHSALCTMYPYCPWNFPVYYSETNSPVCHSERSEESYLNNSQSAIPNPKHVLDFDRGSAIVRLSAHDEVQNLSPTSIGNLKSGVAIKETLVGGRVHEITGNEKAVTKVSHFKGNDPSQWKTNISTYDVVSLGEVYDGIELKLKAYGNNVEKLFCVKPGANPEQIKISLSGIQPSENPPPLSPSVRGTGGCPPLAGAGGGLGARGLWVNEHGELVAETELGAVKFTKPIAYQEINGKRVEVDCKYVMQDRSPSSVRYSKQMNTKNGHAQRTQQTDTDNEHDSRSYCFTVASYDKSHDLIIDPLLASTFLGGRGGESGKSLTLDTSGNVYVTGKTGSPDFPTTSGAYDTSYNNGDVFVSKLDGGLTSLLASTYLGGSDTDYGYSLTLDTSGNVYVTGYTDSTDFPTMSGAYDTSSNGGSDVFVSKLNGELTTLLASSYLGGSTSDIGYSLTLDTSGNVYVTGETSSSDFPTTSEAYDTSSIGYEVFVSKLNGGLTSLLASTYLGGSGSDIGYSLTLDTSGNVYVTGETSSSDFPTMSGAYDTSQNNSYNEVFVSKLDGELTSLLASTYLGGSSGDGGYSLALDTSGNVYVTGSTVSSDFPTTVGAYDTSSDYHANKDEVFVSKLDSSLTRLLASTYLGGSRDEIGHSLALDASGNVYVMGHTYSTDFPTTSGAYDTSRGGDYNIFVSKLNGELTTLLASTYLGGSGGDYGDYGYSLTLDTTGNVYVTGQTWSSDFPTTSGVYDTSYKDRSDAFVSKLDSDLTASYGQISGYVYDMKGNPVESAMLKLKGVKLGYSETTYSDDYGFFEFVDLDAGTYIIISKKKGYKRVKSIVEVNAGRAEEIEISIKKLRKKIVKH